MAMDVEKMMRESEEKRKNLWGARSPVECNLDSKKGEPPPTSTVNRQPSKPRLGCPRLGAMGQTHSHLNTLVTGYWLAVPSVPKPLSPTAW
jgi:hypothetical protein